MIQKTTRTKKTRTRMPTCLPRVVLLIMLMYTLIGQAALAPTDCSTGSVRENIITNQTVLHTDPGNVAAQLGLAQCYLRQDQPVIVEKYLQAVLDANAQNVTALKLYGLLYSRQGRWAEARRVYEQRVALTPKDPKAYGDLYGVLRQLGEEAAAKPVYETYKKLKGLD